MAFVAVIGAGPIGGAIAQTVALRDRICEVRLIDPYGSVAQGKALDIQQSAAVEQFSARIGAAHALHAAAGAGAIVIADSAETTREHAGETGLATVRQLAAIETGAPLVFAGTMQRELMGRSVAELRIPRSRVLGSAPVALESALRALAGLALDRSGVEVQLRLVGTPPGGVSVGWEEATASGMPLRAQLAPHLISALSSRIPKLWPPGPFALASAATDIAEAILNGSRRPFSCFVALDAGPSRQSVVAMPMAIGPGGIAQILEPALTPQERTQMENAVEWS